ncbi:hypothetical protein NC652_029587 [Populus alba x Populus x berolinensis]|nr:hypothetical protein NC652_029587 [Populus alba x Populus x berolinensis]
MPLSLCFFFPCLCISVFYLFLNGPAVLSVSVFYSLWQTPYVLRFRLLFVALSETLSLQSLCFFVFLCSWLCCMPVVCFRQGDVFHMEVDYAGLALQLNGDSPLLWLQNTSRSVLFKTQ